MAITYINNIVSYRKDSSNILKSIVLSVTASEGVLETSNRYDITLSDTGSTVVDYDSLTEDNVINWYLEHPTKSTIIKEELKLKLYNEVTGSSLIWNT